MFQALIARLSQLGQPSARGLAGADAQAADVDAVVRFEELVGELHLAAMQIAVVTSGVNALRAGIKLKNPLALEDLGPQIPNEAKLALPRICREELGIGFKSIAAVRGLFTELTVAQKDVEVFCADAQQFGVEEAAFLDLGDVTDKWRCLSLHALAAVVALEADVARCLPGRYTRNGALLKKLLRSAMEGGHPCVDSNATIKLPDLPQRRAAVRPNVHLPCVLESHGLTFQAVAKDISTGGVGLEDAPPLVPQTVVLVEFETGDCLAGVVVWSKGRRAGVKFDAPLRPNHRLLAPRAA
jgi:PilZ domain